MGRQLHSLLLASDQLNCPGVAVFCPHLATHRTYATPPASPSRVASSLRPLTPLRLPFSPRRDLSPRPPSLVHSPLTAINPSAESNAPTALRAYGVTGQLVRVRAVLGPLDTEEVPLFLPRLSHSFTFQLEK